jgi:hypothetical protein
MQNEKGLFLCDCHSLNHVYQLWYDEESNDLHWYIVVRNYKNVFQRIWRALGYIVGKKPRYGDYDGIIINPEDIKRIRPYFDKVEVSHFLAYNQEIKKAGIECWRNEDKFHRWLLSTTMISKAVCGGRVIDMEPKQILDEIGRIEGGVFA